MTRTDHADWITAATLQAESRRLRNMLESALPPQRVTEILGQASAAAAEGRNLSAMLLHGTRIVACLIAVTEPVPTTDARSSEHRIRVLALAARPGHRHRTPMLLLRLAATRRERMDLASLTVVVDSTEPAAALAGRHRLWRRLGLAVDAAATQVTTSLVLRDAPMQLHAPQAGLLGELRRREVVPGARGPLTLGVIETRRGWDLLRPCWNELLAATPGATALQTFEFQRAWWNHIGWGNALWIVVALRDEQPVAILPMQIEPKHWLGAELRLLSFIGYAPESDRPRLIAGAAAAEVAPVLAAFLLRNAQTWAQISLTEQADDEAFARAMIAALQAGSYHRARGEPIECLHVNIAGDWAAYLGGRSKALRKSLRRKLSRLQNRGRVDFQSVSSLPTVDDAFTRFLQVEGRSWKSGTTVGVRRHPGVVSLYRDLARRLAADGTIDFRFLTVDGQDVAATFGIRWQSTYYSLHISHDAQYDDCSPGVLLTSMELERAFRDRDLEVFDFLSGVPANKSTWSTSSVVTRDLQGVRPGVVGSAFFVIYFYVKPALKRALDRLDLLQLWTRFKALTLGRHVKDTDRDD